MNVLEKAFRIKKNHANDINEFCQVGTNRILARQFLSCAVLSLMCFLTCSDNYNIHFDGTKWILGFCSSSANKSEISQLNVGYTVFTSTYFLLDI